jgi:hypothetical protein
MKDKNYNMNQFLENYFYAGWNAIYEVQILDDNNIIEPIIENNINIEERGYFINDQIQWNNTDDGNNAFYNVKTSKYITLTGFLGNLKMDKVNNLGNLINIKVKLNEEMNETCTIGLISLDDKKLENSEKLLLTIVGKVRNTNQVWNSNRTSTINSGWGKAPTLVQFIEIEAELKFKEEEKPKVYSINNYGELYKEFDIKGNRNKWILKSDEENPTLNYYIIRKLPFELSENKKQLKENYGSGSSIIIIICVIVLIIMVVNGILYLRRRKRKQTVNNIDEGFFNDI